jgi:hypothetical protein
MSRAVPCKLAIALGLVMMALPCKADIVTVRGVSIRTGEDVGAYIKVEGGRAYIDFPGTQRWALAGSSTDYHAMSPEVVREAVEAIDYPIDDLGIEMLILSVPRSRVPESSAEGRVIFLSPGKVDYPCQHIHYIVTHEIGHAVQHMLMPGSRGDLWETYGALRGLDYDVMGPSASHSMRPAEVFAEDFRALFGSESARFEGNVENHDIPRPEDVPGLKEFLMSLLGEWENNVRVSAFPNPFESAVVFEVFNLGGAAYALDVTLFDVRGRVIRSLSLPPDGKSCIVWDGSDETGKQVPPGMYFADVRTEKGSTIRKLIRR